MNLLTAAMPRVAYFVSNATNCSSTPTPPPMLDPYDALVVNSTCDPEELQDCALGDLSGKYGAMEGPVYTAK